MIQCIVNSTRPISADLSAFLYRKASIMAEERMERMMLDAAECYGSLSTEGECANIGTYSGVIFIAKVVANGHEIEVQFIMRIPDVDARPEYWQPAPMSEIRAKIAEEGRPFYGPN